MFFTLDCLHGTISFHHSDMFFFQLNIFYFERIFDLLKLGRKASSQGGLSGWLKNGTVLVCFIFPRFEINADRNLNIEGSAEKLVALVLSKIRAFIT